MGVDCDEETIAHIVHTTSHAEMARNAFKFNIYKIALKMSGAIGEEPLPESEFVGRIRKDGGKLGEGKERLPLEIQQHIDQMWQEIVTTKLGFEDLDDMRAAWKKEQSSQ